MQFVPFFIPQGVTPACADVFKQLYLFPRHWHVLQQFEQGVWHVLECPQVDSLVVAVLAAGHVSVVTDDLPDVLWRHVLLLGVHETELSLLSVSLGLRSSRNKNLFKNTVCMLM